MASNCSSIGWFDDIQTLLEYMSGTTPPSSTTALTAGIPGKSSIILVVGFSYQM